MSLVDRIRVKQARALFSSRSSNDQHTLSSTFECLGNELYIRMLTLRQLNTDKSSLQRMSTQERAFRYASARFGEILFRFGQIKWMQRILSSAKENEQRLWRIYAGLAIKDFHFDLSSFMDSLAPVLIQVQGTLKPKDRKKLPGFPDVQSSTKRSYRSRIPYDLLDIIDRTDTWWPSVKTARDILAHREHLKIVFGVPTQGVLFQLYEKQQQAVIIDPALLWPGGRDVVDFYLYSAFVISEVLVLLEELSEKIAVHLDFSKESLTPAMREGDFGQLVTAMDKLIKKKSRGP